ncbi:inhibitor of growth proteins N-terminal histone-binding-domain-containing protein [Fusarium redolens]|jgi:inhibitor of growth protein 3|uniref:Chromatin modification-related protein n=1 Tax=Fusarium redolens TaxID=48865 RepID=A0A9P9KXQ2_FUSRE|nr:inhibitor of growth proteins N-terminal histone-binding-domain-containing protein [Fusarium redolens]KAH7270466.1 inhibitor of growth proteins N-terminal histone-binding-domain-containing protein [Fusarium redolens]
MPRDDLSIDFVKRMPQAEALDPGLILDDWINRVQNLPEEIRFIQEEVADKDRQYHECLRTIEDRDGKIQKWIKTNGSHEPNPKEELLRKQVRDSFAQADQLSKEKIALCQKMQIIVDKHLKNLDNQIKLLYDRAEPGFTDPDEVPSLLRPSAANHTAPSIRAINPASHMTTAAGPSTPLAAAQTSSNPALARLPNHPNVRHAQAQQHSASAPATPAASMILNRQREGSAGPATKRVARVNPALGTVPNTSSGLARHSSLGPGTPKGGAVGGSGLARAGSAGPRTGSVKSTGTMSGRRGTPTGGIRKKPTNKSNLSRVKKASNRNSPAPTNDSELSDVDSGSGEDEDGADGRSRGTPVADGKDVDGDDIIGDADDDDEEGGDDKKYCLCHNVSYGDMVACDNDNCPYEWFHWSCVDLKSEPNGTWYCPKCREKLQKKGK